MSMPECSIPPQLSSTSLIVLDGPISSVVIILGIIGNLYSVKQLFQRDIHMTMLVSLTGLAIADVILLLASFFHNSLWGTMYYFNLRDEPWDKHYVPLLGLVESGHITSTWMLIEVTAERFYAVTRPFHFAPNPRKQRRKSYGRVLTGLIKLPLFMTAIACVLSIPCSFEYDLEPCTYRDVEYVRKHETSLVLNPYYKFFYRAIFMSISKTFGPFMIIFILTISTMKSMRKSMDSRASILIAQGQNHLFKADQDKTKSLQAISVMLLAKFLLLRCWPTAALVFQMFFGKNTLNFLPFDVSHFFLLLNSATNSFVFVVVKSAFETRRLKRIRERQRRLVAQHAEQVLCIGKALAGDKLLLIPDTEADNSCEDESYELQPMMPESPSSSNPV